MTSISYDLLLEYKKNSLLKSSKHPNLPLEIWNYTEKVQYDDLWDDLTSNHRGTIRDMNGNLVARSFSKFFNIEQNRHKESSSFEIYDKLDGSLGILFNYNDQWILSTKGSFQSEQSIKAFEILQKYKYQDLDKNLSYIFEIIYPENRIVLDYGQKESLILLAVFDIQGNEYNINEYSEIFEIVKKYDFKNYKEIKNLNWEKYEGFIVKFDNGSRCKIKFENYVELHRKLSNISEKAVWEIILEERNISEFLDIVPDEFHPQIKKWYSILTTSYNQIKNEISEYFNDLPKLESRKEIALHIKDYAYKSMIFKKLDNKNYHEDICKLIKPESSKSLIFEKD